MKLTEQKSLIHVAKYSSNHIIWSKRYQ